MSDSDNAVDALVDSTPDIEFKDLIVRALVQSFFQPQMTGLLHHQDPNSGHVSSIPQFADAPMASLVRRFHEQYGQQVVVASRLLAGQLLDDARGHRVGDVPRPRHQRPQPRRRRQQCACDVMGLERDERPRPALDDETRGQRR